MKNVREGDFYNGKENTEAVRKMNLADAFPKGKSEWLNLKAIAYDMVLNGVEIGGGSLRIYQNDIQEKVFEAIGLTQEAAHDKFGFMLDAFKYGAPPHGGLAFALDRLIMLMAKRKSIRDVIAFPKTQSASDVMSQAPSAVDEKQLKELSIRTAVKKKHTEENK